MKSDILLTMFVAAATLLTSQAEVPLAISYQGRIQVNGTNFTGTGQFKFAFVDVGSNTVRQAQASAVVTSGFITGINIIDGGSGYTAAPEVQITDTTGSGATALAQVSEGVVTSVIIQNAGNAYSGNPIVTIAPPPTQLAFQTFWSNDGTSVNGSEPLNFIQIPVTDGLFSVVLGDGSIANNPQFFSNPGIHLRIWFNDGSQGFAQLAPDQAMTSVLYAFHAQMADNVSETAGLLRSIESQNGSLLVASDLGSVNLSIAPQAITDVEIKDGSITPAKLAAGVIPSALPPSGPAGGDLAGSYPAPEIRAGAVSGDKIAAGGVDLDRLDESGADAGDVIGFDGTVADWRRDSLRLPFTGTNVANSGDTFRLVDQSDTNAQGNLLRLDVQGTNSTRLALRITTAARGVSALEASTAGGGSVARFTKTVDRDTGNGGTFIGPVFVASSTGESKVTAAEFSALNSENARPAVDIEHRGLGVALQVDAMGTNIATFRRRRDTGGGGSSTSTVIRFDATGKGFFDGGTQTGGADIAEAFEVTGILADYEPGDVLIISTERARQMTRSTQSYSSLVAGVIATKPGVLLTEKANDEDLSSHVPLGVLGVIPTKVTAENGPIAIGDLLVTSSTLGHAMKGNPAQIRDHPGCIIGKALEPFDANTHAGMIRVLVNVR